MTSPEATAGPIGASTSKLAGISLGQRLVARSCEVAPAAPEQLLSLGLDGQAGFWDARALGDPQALAQAGVAWSLPISSDVASGAFSEAGHAASRLLDRLAVPGLRALVAVPFDGERGFVRLPRFAFAVTEAGGRLIAIGDPQTQDVDADLATLRRAWEEAPRRPRPAEARPSAVLDDGRSRYRKLVGEALSAIAGGTFEKVVTARSLEIALAEEPNLAALVEALPRARVARFLVEQGTEAFFGATPETLVRLADGVARADALAGSRPAPFSEEPAVAAALAEELLGSDKDQREHALVVAFVRRALQGLGSVAPAVAPTLVRLPNVWHLHTPIAAHVRSGVTAFDLVAALHPTPAVLGVPSLAARAWLRTHEGFARGLYAGSIGTLDARGEGTFVVGIRSARLFRDAEVGAARASLYAGGGIVTGSDVETELDETDAKLRPLRRVLGCPGDPR